MRASNVCELIGPSATKKRMLLALYIDYLLFCAPWTIVVWVLTTALSISESEPFSVRIILFMLLEVLILKYARWSPGQWLLGIQDVSRIDLSTPIAQSGVQITKVVEPWLRSNERWWTILFGVLVILNGTKSMIRWTTWSLPTPFFGIQLGEVSSALLMTLLGIFECTVGMAALRLKPIVLPLGALYYTENLISVLLSWHLWPQWIEKAQTARRQYQGLPVRPREIELMQAIVPTAFVVFLVATLVYLAIVYLRVRKANAP